MEGLHNSQNFHKLNYGNVACKILTIQKCHNNEKSLKINKKNDFNETECELFKKPIPNIFSKKMFIIIKMYVIPFFIINKNN